MPSPSSSPHSYSLQMGKMGLKIDVSLVQALGVNSICNGNIGSYHCIIFYG